MVTKILDLVESNLPETSRDVVLPKERGVALVCCSGQAVELRDRTPTAHGRIAVFHLGIEAGPRGVTCVW